MIFINWTREWIFLVQVSVLQVEFLQPLGAYPLLLIFAFVKPLQICVMFVYNSMEITLQMNKKSKKDLLREIRQFAKPDAFRSYMQLGTTAGTLFLCVAVTLTYQSKLIWCSTWIVSLVMLMRLVIFQHDCGHKSFLASKTQNKVIGYILGIPTTIPFGYWCLSHNTHHRNQSNLDARSDRCQGFAVRLDQDLRTELS